MLTTATVVQFARDCNMRAWGLRALAPTLHIRAKTKGIEPDTVQSFSKRPPDNEPQIAVIQGEEEPQERHADGLGLAAVGLGLAQNGLGLAQNGLGLAALVA